MAKPSPRERLIDDLHNRAGAVSPALRRAVIARTSSLADEPPSEDVPAHLHDFIDKVAKHAYKVTDEDVEELARKHSTREIYEITVAAAVGAAHGRLELAMTMLRTGRSS